MPSAGLALGLLPNNIALRYSITIDNPETAGPTVRFLFTHRPIFCARPDLQVLISTRFQDR